MCLRTRKEASGEQGAGRRVSIFVMIVGGCGVAVSSARPGPSHILEGPSGRGFQSRLQGQEGDIREMRPQLSVTWSGRRQGVAQPQTHPAG